MTQQLILHNDVQQIEQLAEYIDSIAEATNIDPSLALSLNLALEEAVTNVVMYAYPEGTDGTVEIITQADNHLLTFIIKDSGTPFDPTQKEDADTTLSAEERPIGGLGIFLVKQIMDEVAYKHEDGQNILTMTKKL
jgi:anti-sigma regulatory factor (Ser/Thr protein kinase)